tara:strand:+ start:749 stop:1822 length:1074 start_codon:yes stop_codon:yes gene_type:complete
MAYTTIDNPSEFFSTTLYTGDGSADQSMTGAGFKPDFLWIKRRNASERHVLTNVAMGVDSGAYKWVDAAALEGAFSGGTGVASFDSDGFTIKTSDSTWNTNGSTYVFWSWKANGGTTATNNDGSLASTVQANTTAGISIVTYSNPSTNDNTIGHGLGVQPEIIIIKNTVDTIDWWVASKYLTNYTTSYVELNSDDPVATHANGMNSTAPTSSVFSVGGISRTGDSGNLAVAYCFASIQGYSKIGSYIGNGNARGPFVWTGFKPAWVMVKPYTNSGYNWVIMDSTRNPFNPIDKYTWADLDNAEYDGTSIGLDVDFVSNGFKLSTSRGEVNLNGATMLYMAFAENPFVSSGGIPTTAR